MFGFDNQSELNIVYTVRAKWNQSKFRTSLLMWFDATTDDFYLT